MVFQESADFQAKMVLAVYPVFQAIVDRVFQVIVAIVAKLEHQVNQDIVAGQVR